ncbi:MAG: ABC transporter ATP-binding protein/permease [Pseudomonadales bacterium]|jgi:ABC-type multidrug transport system fused ATPase/permease subunit|nr:ABC transporter ATP-binding protein/permease [Pseudomonadales bacterium]
MKHRRLLRYRDLIGWKDCVAVIAIGMGNAASLALLVILTRGFFQSLTTAGIDSVMNGLALPAILSIASLAILQAGLAALEYAVPESISFRIAHKLRLALHAHMAAMAPRQIQHRSRGSLILRLTGDLTMLRTWIGRGMGRGFIALLALAGCLGVIASFNWRLAAVAASCFVLGALISMRLGRRLGARTAWVRRSRSLLTSNIDEQVNALAVVQTSGHTHGEAMRLQRQSESMTRALTREAWFRGFLRAISSSTGWLTLIAVVGVGLYEVSVGRLDLASIAVISVVIHLMQGYVRSLALAHDYWRRAEVSRRKLEDFLGSSSRLLSDPTKQPMTQNRAAITFESVSVPGALHGFSARIGAGQHVAITGPSGAGKSTILQAVAQMATLTGGDILIGEQRLSECSIASIVRKIGIVSPDLPLMRGTIRRNLTYRVPNITEENLSNFIDRCQLRPLIEALPGGLNYWVTEGGANLSIGTRQVIALGRALLGSPPILLLDEATKPLDRDYRQLFRTIITRQAATVLQVTDDPEDIEYADAVWEVERGKLKVVISVREYLSPYSGQATRPRPLASAG